MHRASPSAAAPPVRLLSAATSQSDSTREGGGVGRRSHGFGWMGEMFGYGKGKNIISYHFFFSNLLFYWAKNVSSHDVEKLGLMDNSDLENRGKYTKFKN